MVLALLTTWLMDGDGAGGEVGVAAGVGGGDRVLAVRQRAGGEGGRVGRRAAERAGADRHAVVVEGDRAGGVGHGIRARAGDAHRRREGDALAATEGLAQEVTTVVVVLALLTTWLIGRRDGAGVEVAVAAGVGGGDRVGGRAQACWW